MKFLRILIFFLAILVPLLTALFFYQRFLNTSSSLDGLSHLYIAKNVIHNGKYSTIKNLGTVWLPFYHLLLIPFVFFDELYFSGFAGTFLNIIILFFIIFYLFKLLPYPYSIFSSLLFLSYPYLLVYTLSPMTEVLTLLLLILTFYYFLKDDINKLIISLILGSLTRYEFYPILLFLFFYYLKKSKKVFLFFSGIIFWFIWNYLLYSDPFYFYNHPVTKNTCGILPYAFNVKELLNFNIKILKNLFGYLPIITFLTFFYLLIYKKSFKLTLLSLPLFTHIFLEYFNISLGYARFYLLSLPFFFITPFIFLKNINQKGFKIVAIFLIFLSFFFNSSIFSVLITGKNHYSNKFLYGHHLDVNYPLVKEKILYFQNFFKDIDLKKKILIPSCQEFQVFSFALKIRPENIFDAYDYEIISIMKEPEKYCEILILENQPDDFSFRFHKYFKNNYYSVLFFKEKEYQRRILNNFYLIKKDNKYSIYLKK